MKRITIFLLIFSFYGCTETMPEKEQENNTSGDSATTENPADDPDDSDTDEDNGYTVSNVVIGYGTEYSLNGMLSMPDNAIETAKVPAVVLVHGSGPSDMDEKVYENKPFRDIAKYLAANGIAVIRYTKRTYRYGEKMLEELGGSLTVYEETIEDAILAAEILKSDPRIDENKVFIIGHSLGGMLAPRIHAEGGDFAGIISLAGSPRTLFDIGYPQTMALIEAMEEGEEKEAQLASMAGFDEQVEFILNLSDDEAKNTPVGAGGMSAYYYKDMSTHPIPEYVKDITVPFLILQGSADFQVYADIDYVAWQELLAGRENVTFKLYDGLNHFFMPSTGRTMAEIAEEYKIAGHIDEHVLSDIADWIKAN